jgi:uncharacterized protein YbaR (Trm112 family)
MDIGGCLYEESVWETDSDSSEEEQSEAEEEPSFLSQLAAEIRVDQAAALEDGAQRLLEMDFGDDESEAYEENQEELAEEKPKVDVSKPLVEPLFALPCGFAFPECAICYEPIEMVNVAVTTCGHVFHASCAFKALDHADCCPMCRHQLVAADEEGEDDEDQEDDEDEQDEDDEEGSQDGEEEEEDTRPTMEQLAVKLQNMGYTATDFLTLFMEGILKRQDETRQSSEFLDDLNAKIDDIVDGKITMAHVDQRTYAQVAAKAPEVRRQQPQPQVAAV